RSSRVGLEQNVRPASCGCRVSAGAHQPVQDAPLLARQFDYHLVSRCHDILRELNSGRISKEPRYSCNEPLGCESVASAAFASAVLLTLSGFRRPARSSRRFVWPFSALSDAKVNLPTSQRCLTHVIHGNPPTSPSRRESWTSTHSFKTPTLRRVPTRSASSAGLSS